MKNLFFLSLLLAIPTLTMCCSDEGSMQFGPKTQLGQLTSDRNALKKELEELKSQKCENDLKKEGNQLERIKAENRRNSLLLAIKDTTCKLNEIKRDRRRVKGGRGWLAFAFGDSDDSEQEN